MPLLRLPNAYGDAATNMAIDAALLDSIPTDIALFRHYGWSEPAITFGYTQRYAEIDQLTPDNATRCRRLTGGGIVDHRNDWTYTLILHTSLPAAHRPSNELYQALHKCLLNAVQNQHVQAALAPCPRACGSTPKNTQLADQCFVHPVAYDVLTPNGQKIAGAALKRTRSGLLAQGSIDRSRLPENFDYARFAEDFIQQLADCFEIPIGHSDDLRTLFNGPLIQQERARFSSTDWTQKR